MHAFWKHPALPHPGRSHPAALEAFLLPFPSPPQSKCQSVAKLAVKDLDEMGYELVRTRRRRRLSRRAAVPLPPAPL